MTICSMLADGLRQVPGLRCPIAWTRISSSFDISAQGMDAAAFEGRMRERGVLFVRIGERLRAVTHLDVNKREIMEAIAAASDVLSGADH